MGACSIGLIIRENASRARVNEIIAQQRIEDRDRNGHCDGYSGDWQTIMGVGYVDDYVFESVNEAADWVLDRVEKREAMAVKFDNGSGEIWTGVWGMAAE